MNNQPHFPVAALTGHRPFSMEESTMRWVQKELDRVCAKLAYNGTTTAICGMALGPDQWWAATALTHGLDLHAYIPCLDQPARWKPHQAYRWQQLRDRAVHERVFGPRYDVRLLHLRNRAMVQDCDVLLAVFAPHRRTGGTATTVRYATGLGKPIIMLDIASGTTTLRTGPVKTTTPAA